MNTKKKIRTFALANYDENQNYTEKPNPGLGYSTITRTITVPNILISTLQTAASESGIAPITSSYIHRPSPSPSPPPVMINTVQSMAERRREKVFLNKRPIELSGQRRHMVDGITIAQPRSGVQSNAKYLPKDTKFLEKLSFHKSESISEMGRTRFDAFKLDTSKCICQREKKTVWCVMCGFNTKGNVVMTCLVHKRVLYGMYICGNPSCMAPRHLVETDF